jgi:hypothetical protein
VHRRQTTVVAHVSHELRTPLTAIIGYLELALEGNAGPVAGRQQELLDLAKRHAERLVDLITAIQDVVAPEEDRLVVATVRHLLRSGRLTGLGTETGRCPPPRQETGSSHSVTGGVRHPSAVARRWLCCWRPCRGGGRGLPGKLTIYHHEGGEDSWKTLVRGRSGRGTHRAWGAGGNCSTPAAWGQGRGSAALGSRIKRLGMC